MITRMRIVPRVISLALVAALALPTGAFAVDEQPQTQESVILQQGFENGEPQTNYTVWAPDPFSAAQWGRWTLRKRSGTTSMWIAGSNPGAVAAMLYPIAENAYTDSWMRFDLTTLAGYHSARTQFYYTMPSVTPGQEKAFRVRWEYPGRKYEGYLSSEPIPLTGINAWSLGEARLDENKDNALARRSGGILSFSWSHFNPTTATPAEGASVDDIVVKGWKYGPVGNLTAALQGDAVRLTWSRPTRAKWDTAPEDRTIAYRVWTRNSGTATWTELTSSGRLPDATVLYDAPIRFEGSVDYLVQPWDTGTGAGYGQWQFKTIAVPNKIPTVGISAPVSGFLVGTDPVEINGTASDDGSGLKDVRVRIRLADGQCWSGSEWVAAETWLPATSSDGYATWSYSWPPPVADQGRMVTVSARATDKAGNASGIVSATSQSTIPEISIEGGEPRTAKRTVNVSISAPTANKMRRSIDGGTTWSAAMNVAASDSVTFPSDGTRSVTYQFSNDNGATWAFGQDSDSIYIDSIAPAVKVTSPVLGSAAMVPSQVRATATDAGTSVSNLKFEITTRDATAARPTLWWTGSTWVPTKTTLSASYVAGAWQLPGTLSYKNKWEPVKVVAVATDELGNAGSGTVTTFDERDPVNVSITPPASTINYGGTATVGGALWTWSGSRAGRTMELLYASSATGTYKRLGSTKTTDTNGRVSFTVKPSSKTYYKVRTADPVLQVKETVSYSVTPRVSLTTPTKPSTVYKNRTFTSTVYLKPKHSLKSQPVRIEAYRSDGYKKSFTATVVANGTYTSKLTAKITLPSTGYWKLRAYAPTDSGHAATTGSYTSSFRVR